MARRNDVVTMAWDHRHGYRPMNRCRTIPQTPGGKGRTDTQREGTRMSVCITPIVVRGRGISSRCGQAQTVLAMVRLTVSGRDTRGLRCARGAVIGGGVQG
jgi:hypothetical protein